MEFIKKLDFDQLNEWISKQQSDVEREILNNRSDQGKRIRTRPRDPDEVKILDHVCIERWKRAVELGKVKYITERAWYYDFD